MSDSQPTLPGGDPVPPMSRFGDSLHDRLRREVLLPPDHPGILGSLEDFEVIQVLGAGGMGIVLLVRDRRDDVPKALKLLRPELADDERLRQRFLAEARRMQQFAHPGIAPVLRIGLTRGLPFFVMPYYPAGSLAASLRRDRLPPGEGVLKIALGLAEALVHAHEHGIIHRDLKPANVLLDQDGRPCLADFGLARNVFNDDVEDIEREHREGTAPYMSPAVAAGKAEDTRCDIYAFGAVLYELLTGRPPYVGEPKAVLEAILAGPPGSIRKVNPGAPADLARIAEWCLARELRERYAEMRDVRDDLERVATGKSPIGPRGSVLRLAAALGFKRWRMLTALLVATALIAGAVALYRMSRPRLSLLRTIKLDGVTGWHPAQIGRIEGEPFPVIFHTDGSRLLTVDSTGNLLYGSRPVDTSRNTIAEAAITGVDGTLSLLGDSTDELVVSWMQGTNSFVSVFNPEAHELMRFSAAPLVALGQESGRVVEDLTYRDLLRGASVEEPLFLAAFAGSRSNAFRGLSAYALESGSVRWAFQMAPYIREVVPMAGDNDEDGTLVVGSYATGNGVSLPDGTSDDRSYVCGLSFDGHPLWRSEIGTAFTAANPIVADLDGDGEREILVWVEGTHDNRAFEGLPEEGLLFVLGLDGQIRHRVDLHATLLSVQVVGTEGAGPKAILATDRFGRVYQIGPDLGVQETRTLEPVRYTDCQLRLSAVTDLDLDGELDLVFTTVQREHVSGVNHGMQESPIPLQNYHDIDLVVRDLKFREKARIRVADLSRQDEDPRLKVAQFDHDPYPEILWLGAFFCHIYDFQPDWWQARRAEHSK